MAEPAAARSDASFFFVAAFSAAALFRSFPALPFSFLAAFCVSPLAWSVAPPSSAGATWAVVVVLVSSEGSRSSASFTYLPHTGQP